MTDDLEQTLEQKFLTVGVNYSSGALGYSEAIMKIKDILDEHDEHCHCCRLEFCECGDYGNQ